jgi:hypothetical protein
MLNPWKQPVWYGVATDSCKRTGKMVDKRKKRDMDTLLKSQHFLDAVD